MVYPFAMFVKKLFNRTVINCWLHQFNPCIFQLYHCDFNFFSWNHLDF